MVVLYQKGLESMAEYLSSQGLELVPFGEADYADALIYSQDGVGLINSLPVESGPLFLINVYGKTGEQVLYMLKNRVYSPLIS